MGWLRAVYFLDQNRGWVAGSNGTLLRTTDGGESWRKLTTLSKDTLNDLFFVDENSGWLLADRDPLRLTSNDESRSYLMKTDDGGLTWRRVLLNTTDANPRLVRFIFADAQHAFVFGEAGILFATRDGGSHWTRQTSPTPHLLMSGASLDYAHAWFVGAGGTIASTADGGATWQIGFVRNGAKPRFTAASFAAMNLGWAVGNEGQIFTTRDGGRSWYAQNANIDADLFDVKFVNAGEGWACGAAGALLHTTDAGAHWIVESATTSHALQRLFFTDHDHGWAVGFGGTILKYSTEPRDRNFPALSPK